MVDNDDLRRIPTGRQTQLAGEPDPVKRCLRTPQLNRLETGIDGMMELRDPSTHAMLGKWIGVQVKTTEGGKYTAETEVKFEYLLDPADLAYWRQSNLSLIIVLVRLSDHSMYWKPVDVLEAS